MASSRAAFDRANQTARELSSLSARFDPNVLSEAVALLTWMENRHFTFLGYREYRLQGRKGREVLQPIAASGLGLLRPGHRHPGPVLAYVLEGQMRFAINNEPVRAIPAGSTFFEPTGALHTGGGSASADARARAVVFMVVPKGSAVVTPA